MALLRHNWGFFFLGGGRGEARARALSFFLSFIKIHLSLSFIRIHMFLCIERSRDRQQDPQKKNESKDSTRPLLPGDYLGDAGGRYSPFAARTHIIVTYRY